MNESGSGRIYRVCSEEQIALLEPLAVKAGRLDLVVLRTEQGIYAFPSRCPHRGGPLAHCKVKRPRFAPSPGKMGLPSEDIAIVCPWHHWQFRVDTGTEVASGDQMLRCLPTEVVDGDVYVRTGRVRDAEG